MGSICDLKEPGGGNIPLIWCLVLIGTLSSNMSWQTQQDKHSLSPAMKYTLSNRPVPFWIHCVGETKAQNKQHSDMALRVITASDRVERAGFGLGTKTQPVIDMIPWPWRSLPFNKSSERPSQQPGPGSHRQQATAGEVYVHVFMCVWELFVCVRAHVCVCIDAHVWVCTCVCAHL